MINKFRTKERMKQICLNEIGETLDDRALYNLIERIYEEIKYVGDVKLNIRVAKKENIQKELTNKGIMKAITNERNVGSTFKSEQVKLMWGRNIELGKLKQFDNCVDENTISECNELIKADLSNAQPGIYCILKHYMVTSHLYDRVHDSVSCIFNQKMHVVFFKI